MPKDSPEYKDLGHNRFARRSNEVKAKRLLSHLAELGYQASLQPIADAA